MLCFHDRLKQFTFSDGQTIKMCPDCSTFDNQRIEVLRTGKVHVADTTSQQHWGLILDDSDLSMSSGHLDIMTLMPLTTANTDELLANPHPMWVERNKRCMAWDGQMLNWADIPSLQPYRRPTKRIKYTTIDDHDWCLRQTPFPHSLSMPRKLNSFCTSCIEMVIDTKQSEVRVTRGVYLPIEHDCARVRVYDLVGKLIEVKSL